MNGCLNRACTYKGALACSCCGVGGRQVAAVGIQCTEATIQLIEVLEIRIEALILRGREDSKSV